MAPDPVECRLRGSLLISARADLEANFFVASGAPPSFVRWCIVRCLGCVNKENELLRIICDNPREGPAGFRQPAATASARNMSRNVDSPRNRAVCTVPASAGTPRMAGLSRRGAWAVIRALQPSGPSQSGVNRLLAADSRPDGSVLARPAPPCPSDDGYRLPVSADSPLYPCEFGPLYIASLYRGVISARHWPAFATSAALLTGI